MKTRNIIALVVTMLCIPALSQAGIIKGVPVDDGDTAQVGTYDATTGIIEYFIPINNGGADGQYGVDDGGNYGLSADSGPTPLGGPVLSMDLYFNIADGMQGDILTLWFDDLDLKDLNTPTGFFETITIGGTYIEYWDDFLDFPDASLINKTTPGNNSDISIVFSNLGLTPGEYWLDLEFTSYDDGLDGYYKNTPEYMSAKITSSVPEPTILALLGMGLLGLGIARRRMRR